MFSCMGLFIDLFFPLPCLMCRSCSSLGNPFGFSGKWISLRPHPPTHSCAHSLGKGSMTVITIIPSFRALIYFLFGFVFFACMADIILSVEPALPSSGHFIKRDSLTFAVLVCFWASLFIIFICIFIYIWVFLLII